jgi:eukaryotic-like serine/threonine-protein kinase
MEYNGMPEAGSIFDGRYKILSSLGRGGFANVFLAEDIQTDERVVIKIPHSGQMEDPVIYERFRREMEIGKLLDHPDIPRVLTLSDRNPPYLVLKFIEGRPLGDILDENGRFPVEQALEMVANLLDTLQYCHQHGVYHRDLKPENLLLAPDGHLKIIDFGIALMKGAPRVTWRGFSGLMGTPEYMAPEQIRGERGSAATDIYAIGCLTYHLLAGVPPFTGDNPLAVMYQHMTKTPDRLPMIVPGLHQGIWAAIRKSLRRRKQERYDSARDMANDLRHPENADLKWLYEPDAPLVMTTTPPTERSNLWLHGLVISIIILLTILIGFLQKH